MSLTIRQIAPKECDVFASLWIPWLRETMGIEPQGEDLDAMRDPPAYYGTTGGAAFVGQLNGKPVGVVAVKGLGEAGFEFCKLVVTKDARGQGAGRQLVEACLSFAKTHGGPALWLQSFNQLQTALGIYHKMGFEHAAAPSEMTVLDRTEVIMRKSVV